MTTYPIVAPVDGGELDPAWGVDITDSANDHESRMAVLEQQAIGYVGQSTNSTTNITSTGTEAIGPTVTLTASAAAIYKITWTGTTQSSIAGDIARIRLRAQSGASLTSSGTQFRIQTVKNETANASLPSAIIATVTGISGQYTVGASIQRVNGTGTFQINGNSTDESYLLVERIQ